MTYDPKLSDLRGIVATGERERLSLVDDLIFRGATSRFDPEGRRGVTVTELMMFYGQAFEAVIAAISGPGGDPRGLIRVLHEAAQGRATYRAWLQVRTPIAAPDHCRRLTEHWTAIVTSVIGE